MSRVCSRREPERMISVVRGERAHRESLGELDRVDEALLRTEGAEPPDLTSGQEEDDEQRIDEGGRGLEEIVVVRSHELAELVDEGAEPRTTDQHRDDTRRRREEQQEENDRDEHSETAPERVGNMQTVAAQLRISGGLKEDANHENRGHGGDEKRVQELRVRCSDQMRQAEI